MPLSALSRSKVSLSLRIPALGLFRGGLNQRVAVLDHVDLEICDSTSDKPPALMLELENDALANERYCCATDGLKMS
jgi:hypothetical protein